MKELGNFILIDSYVRKRAERDVLFIVLDTPYNLEREKEVIEYRKQNVILVLHSNEEDKYIKDHYKLHEVRYKDLKNGSRLQIIFSHDYDKEKELEQVELRNHSVLAKIEKINEELFEEEDINNEEDEQQDYS